MFMYAITYLNYLNVYACMMYIETVNTYYQILLQY